MSDLSAKKIFNSLPVAKKIFLLKRQQNVVIFKKYKFVISYKSV